MLAADGARLAEVADDRVVGTDVVHDRTAVWREVEVELVTGDRALLAVVARRLIDAGATPSSWSSKLARTLGEPSDGADAPAGHRTVDAGSSAGDVVVAHLAEQVDVLVRFDPLVRQDAEDAVHKIARRDAPAAQRAGDVPPPARPVDHRPDPGRAEVAGRAARCGP